MTAIPLPPLPPAPATKGSAVPAGRFMALALEWNKEVGM